MREVSEDYSVIHENLRKLLVPLIQNLLKQKPLDYIEFCANYFQRLLKESNMTSTLREQIQGNEDYQDKPALHGSVSLSALPECKGLNLRGTSSWNHPGETKKSHLTRPDRVFSKADFSRKMGDQPDIIQEHAEVTIVDKTCEKKSDSDEQELFDPGKRVSEKEDCSPESRPLHDEEIEPFRRESRSRTSTSPSSLNKQKDGVRQSDSSSSSDSDDSYHYIFHDNQKELLISDLSSHEDVDGPNPPDVFTLCDCEDAKERLNWEHINSLINTFSEIFHNSISQLRNAESCFTECLIKELKIINQNQNVGEDSKRVTTENCKKVKRAMKDSKKMPFVYQDYIESVLGDSRHINSSQLYQTRQTSSKCKHGKNCSYKKGEIMRKNASGHNAMEDPRKVRKVKKYYSKFKGKIRNDNFGINAETKMDMLNVECVNKGNPNPFISKPNINKRENCLEDKNNLRKPCANTHNTGEEELKQVNADHQKYASRRNPILKYQSMSHNQNNSAFYKGGLIPFQYVRPNILNPYAGVARVVPTTLEQQIGEQGDVLPQLRRHRSVGTEYRQTNLGSESRLTAEDHENDMNFLFNYEVTNNGPNLVVGSEHFSFVSDESKLTKIENTKESSGQLVDKENTKKNNSVKEKNTENTKETHVLNHSKSQNNSDSNSFSSSEDITEENKLLKRTSEKTTMERFNYLIDDINSCENQPNFPENYNTDLRGSNSAKDKKEVPISKEFIAEKQDFSTQNDLIWETEAELRYLERMNTHISDTHCQREEFSAEGTSTRNNTPDEKKLLTNEIISSTIEKQDLQPGLEGGDFVQTSLEERHDNNANMPLNFPKISLESVEAAVREALEAQVEDGEGLYLTDNDLSVGSSDEEYSSEIDDAFDKE